MVKFIMGLLDYWVMWHFSLAILAFMIFYRFVLNKQLAMICTMGLALFWEIFDSLFLGDTLKNSLIDLLTAIVAVFIIATILKDRELK